MSTDVFVQTSYTHTPVDKEFYGSKDDVIVVKSLYSSLGDAMCSVYRKTAESLDSYVKELTLVANTSVLSGETHDAMLAYISLFEGISNKIIDIGEQFKSSCERFVSDVVEAGKRIYDDDCDRLDFSKDTIDMYKRRVDDTKNFIAKFCDNWLNNALEKISYDVLQLKIRFGYKPTKPSNRATIIDYLDFEKKDVDAIYICVKDLDTSSSKTFKALFEDYANLVNIIHEAHMIVSNASAFTKSNILSLKSRLDNIDIEDNKEILEEELTLETAEEFCSNDENLVFYEDYSEKLQEARDEMNMTDAVIASVAVSGEFAVAQHLESILVPESISDVEAYDYLMVKKSLADTITKISGNELDYEDIFKKLELGVNIAEIFEMETYENARDTYYYISNLVNEGIAVAGLEIEVLKIILPIFLTYVKNEEVIRSLARGTDPNSYTAIAVQELCEEYKKSYLMSAKEFVSMAIKKCAKTATKEINGVITGLMGTAGKKLSVATFAVEKVAELSGLEAIGKDTYKFHVLQKENGELEKAFQHNFKEISDGEYTKEDVVNLNNSYKILQNNYAKEFELLSTIAGKKGKHDLKRYYQYLGDNIKDTPITAVNSVELMSFKEFINS